MSGIVPSRRSRRAAVRPSRRAVTRGGKAWDMGSASLHSQLREGKGSVSWRYLAVATEAVLRAGAIQRARYGQKLDIRFKGVIDLVTDVDRACEEAILDTIRSRFPD